MLSLFSLTFCSSLACNIFSTQRIRLLVAAAFSPRTICIYPSRNRTSLPQCGVQKLLTDEIGNVFINLTKHLQESCIFSLQSWKRLVRYKLLCIFSSFMSPQSYVKQSFPAPTCILHCSIIFKSKYYCF